MFSWLLCLMCCNIGFILCNTVDVFEFGDDDHSGRIVFNVVGSIGKTWRDKVTKIPITLPYCMNLVYVRVEVDNSKGPPHVSMDKKLLTVTIKYRVEQYSTSAYLVTAKAKPMKACNAYYGY